MFFKKKYEMKELYVGILGYVTYKDDSYQITQVNEIIIFERKRLSDYDSDYYAENIFTNKPYFFFHGNTYYYNTLDKAINNYAVHEYYPLETYLTEPKKIITEQELLNIYKEIKKIFKNSEIEENNSDSEEKITDDILKLILKTNELAQKSKISPDRKNEIIEELDELGKQYINEMIQFTAPENNSLILEDEYNIKMNYIRKLVDLETKIKDPRNIKTYSLKKEYNQFQSLLKSKS